MVAGFVLVAVRNMAAGLKVIKPHSTMGSATGVGKRISQSLRQKTLATQSIHTPVVCRVWPQRSQGMPSP